MWIRKAQLPCWPSSGQQVVHQRWIWGIYCMLVMKQTREGSLLALKPRADVTIIPKLGKVAPQKDSYPGRFWKKNLNSTVLLQFRPNLCSLFWPLPALATIFVIIGWRNGCAKWKLKKKPQLKQVVRSRSLPSTTWVVSTQNWVSE